MAVPRPPGTPVPRPPGGSVQLSDEGVVAGCDEDFVRMLGLPRERIVGERLCELLSPQAQSLREREELLVQVEALVANLQEAIDTRDEFLSVASHELKTPLAALQLQIDALLPGAARPGQELSPRIRDKLDAIQRAGRRVGQLVNDLLDVSRIRAGRMDLKLEPVDLSEVAREAVERFRHEAAHAGSELHLEVSGPLVGAWDRMRLDQVVANLISNAVKYGDGKPVEVAAWWKEGVARLAVADHGIGIPRAQHERIFRRFERAVSSSRAVGGLGLGLWIAREIVTRLGGVIRVESEVGRGSVFTVELPVELPAAGREMEPGPGA
jgi:signal transduction histidine kinase